MVQAVFLRMEVLILQNCFRGARLRVCRSWCVTVYVKFSECGSGGLEELCLNSLQKNAAVHVQHSYLHRLLSEHEIGYCVLKGCASAFYYPEPIKRAMGDVDFLVRRENVARASETLKADGFQQWEQEHICHIVFRKKPMHYELHFEPTGMPEGEARVMMEGYLEDIFEQAGLVRTKSAVYVKPSDFHHGLVIFLHTYHHLMAEGVGLRHLCDLAVFFDHFSNKEFMELYYEKLSAVGLWQFVRIMGQVCHQALGLPYREWMGDVDEALCADVIADIFAGGNFGKKDGSRWEQDVAISNRGKDGVGKPKLIQILCNINVATLTNYPFLKKVPVLRHLAWILRCIRYVGEVATGKKKRVNIVRVMSEAERRKQIYKQFHLFER